MILNLCIILSSVYVHGLDSIDLEDYLLQNFHFFFQKGKDILHTFVLTVYSIAHKLEIFV